MSRILLVDDETDFLDATARALRRRGFVVGQATDARTALTELGREPYDVAVLDVRLQGESGVDLFRKVHELYPRLPVLLLTGHGAVQQAFETVREGVFEYLTKPCSIDKLVRVAERAVAAVRAGGSPPSPTGREPEICVLLVDPEPTESVATFLRSRHMRVTTAVDGSAALLILSREEVEVAVVDASLDGLALLKRMKQLRPALAVILATAQPLLSDAVRGIREGAFDVLTKPLPLAALATRIHDAWQVTRDANGFPKTPQLP
jgi:DNA-binding NtrC family response regulator